MNSSKSFRESFFAILFNLLVGLALKNKIVSIKFLYDIFETIFFTYNEKVSFNGKLIRNLCNQKVEKSA